MIDKDASEEAKVSDVFTCIIPCITLFCTHNFTNSYIYHIFYLFIHWKVFIEMDKGVTFEIAGESYSFQLLLPCLAVETNQLFYKIPYI